MTIGGWIMFGVVFLLAALFGCLVAFDNTVKTSIRIVIPLVSLIVCIVAYFCLNWFFTSTAMGQRAMVDQRSNIANGLERTVTVYTADGEVIAQYTGRIDIEGNNGGYVLFDYEGKRYTYYNCFVESIADIE